jgi:GMP synthase (glutamine-hydrolysing)
MPTPQRILVFRHEPFEHLGYFAEILNQHDIPFVYRNLDEEPPEPALSAYTGLVVMGGPQSANDPLPGIRAELKWIEQALAAKIPILGICLGAQLLAKALGARIYKNGAPEIGWEPVFFTETSAADPVFGGLPSPTTFFHWHGETFDLPGGAEWLAYSEKCRHQAFRWGRTAYGIQFHPEITPEMIVDWSSQPANCGDVATLPGPIDAHAFDTASLARRVFEGWLGTFLVQAAEGSNFKPIS